MSILSKLFGIQRPTSKKTESLQTDTIIGIDLGTTYSVVAVMEGSNPKVISNASSSSRTPSVVGFTDKGERLVGQTARQQQVTNPENTVFAVKRFVGRRHNEVDTEEKIAPYKIVGNPDELVRICVYGKEYTPQEIAAIILQDVKRTAEEYLGETVAKAVITAPAYFNISQRQAIRDAGKIAGLEVERIISESTAAALAYGLNNEKNQKVAVLDFGGGTFDVSILDISDKVFEVLSTNGDTHLGGFDLDAELAKFLVDEFEKKEKIDLRKDVMAHQRLIEAAEQAKCELSVQMETTIHLPFITADTSGPKHLKMTVTRSKFEAICEPIFERLRVPCQKALADAKLQPSDISEILLAGGSTRISKVREIAKEIFGKDPNLSLNPDEVVALGAAIQGAILSGESVDARIKDMLLLDVTPLSLGVETLGGVMTKIIERNTTIPTSNKETFSTAADNQTSVDIHVLQGEREFARDNRTLGRFQLEDIPPAPRNLPQIQVTFDIDGNGILNISAKDLGTGKHQSITIKTSSGLSEDEVNRMIKEAKANSEADKRHREVAALRNQADQIVCLIEKILKEQDYNISADILNSIESAMNCLKKAVNGEDPNAIKKAIDNIVTIGREVGDLPYETD